MIKPKAQRGDKIKIINEHEIRSLYDKEDNIHTRNTLIYLSQQDLVGEVIEVCIESEDLYSYKIAYAGLMITLYDCDFYKLEVPSGKLYEDVPVYLCIDISAGQYDRLCFGEKALIEFANASVECWNEGLNTDDYGFIKLKTVETVENALNILANDNFEVIKIKHNSAIVTESYVVSDCDVTIYDNNDIIYHSPEHIWKLITSGQYNKTIVDLTVSYYK